MQRMLAHFFAFHTIVGWVEPTGRANARPMTGSAKPINAFGEVMGFAALNPSYAIPIQYSHNQIQVHVRNPAARCARVVHESLARKRAWGMPGAQCTRSLACENKKHTSVVTTGPPEQPGIPARNGFNGLLRALPGDRAFLSPSSVLLGTDLTPASRRQDHTTSPSASQRSRQQRRLRPPHPAPYVRDDRETPLCVGRDGGGYTCDLGQRRREIFLQMGLDWGNQIEMLQEITFYRNPIRRPIIMVVPAKALWDAHILDSGVLAQPTV